MKYGHGKMKQSSGCNHPDGPVTTDDNRFPATGKLTKAEYMDGVQTVNMGSIKVSLDSPNWKRDNAKKA